MMQNTTLAAHFLATEARWKLYCIAQGFLFSDFTSLVLKMSLSPPPTTRHTILPLKSPFCTHAQADSLWTGRAASLGTSTPQPWVLSKYRASCNIGTFPWFPNPSRMSCPSILKCPKTCLYAPLTLGWWWEGLVYPPEREHTEAGGPLYLHRSLNAERKLIEAA